MFILALGITVLAIIFFVGALASPAWLAVPMGFLSILMAWTAWLMAGTKKENL